MVRSLNYSFGWNNIFKKNMKKIYPKLPLIFTVIIFGFLLYFLTQDKNPSNPPSALLNKQMPKFESNDLIDENYQISGEKFYGKKIIINFFASWCSPCKVEHPLLIEIANNHSDVLMIGVNHKDKKDDAMNFLESGNPYDQIALDKDGKIAMEFGVYGLPETFVINEKGIIVFAYVGPITNKIYEKKIKRLLSN